MDQGPLVERQIEDGKRLIAALDAASLEVDAAFWFYFEEPEEWRLVIASPAVHRIGPRRLYLRIAKLIDKQLQGNLSFDLAQIVVVGPDHPIVSGLKGFLVTPLGIFGSKISNITINHILYNAYLYRNLPMPA